MVLFKWLPCGASVMIPKAFQNKTPRLINTAKIYINSPPPSDLFHPLGGDLPNLRITSLNIFQDPKNIDVGISFTFVGWKLYELGIWQLPLMPSSKLVLSGGQNLEFFYYVNHHTCYCKKPFKKLL